MSASLRLAMDAWLCRCGRFRRWLDAMFEGPFDVVGTDEVCGAKERQSHAVYPALEQYTTIHIRSPRVRACGEHKRSIPF